MKHPWQDFTECLRYMRNDAVFGLAISLGRSDGRAAAARRLGAGQILSRVLAEWLFNKGSGGIGLIWVAWSCLHGGGRTSRAIGGAST